MARLQREYDWHDLTAAADPRALLAANASAIEAVVTSAGLGIDAALIDALPKLRMISSFGVGLDRIEPRELFTLDNVVLLPHVASATEQTRAAMAERVFDNLQSFFATGRPVSSAL